MFDKIFSSIYYFLNQILYDDKKIEILFLKGLTKVLGENNLDVKIYAADDVPEEYRKVVAENERMLINMVRCWPHNDL